MSDHQPDMPDSPLDPSRRRLLVAAGLASAGLGVGLSARGVDAAARPIKAAELNSAPPVAGLHLQFGADASSQVVVSWHTLQPVRRPRVLIGHLDGHLQQTVGAEHASYTDAKAQRVVYAYHAKVSALAADTAYLYGAVHEGATAEFGTFRTAPRGRASFTFTSFGDQGTPTLGKRYKPPAGVTLPDPPFVNDNRGSPAAADTTLGVERLQPLFHLFNGDLCYANLAEDRVRTWWDFWSNNTRSARNRPWMPSPGNHENELGNGPIGYHAYQTYFSVPPAAGQTDITRGLWYGFTAGSIRIISLANDDVVYQYAGDSYVRGYSRGAQKAWLEQELAKARANPEIDWIVICMHQVAISTADAPFNGADLGIREEWSPLFDKYGVDLVVCGHEHHYERSHPVRGHGANQTLTPLPAATDVTTIDTTRGTVHMVIGSGGTSAPSNGVLLTPPRCRVIVGVEPPDGPQGYRRPVYVMEDAPWSAARNASHAYGFAAFTVDPGTHASGITQLKVTYYDVVSADGQVIPFESFTLRRPRADSLKS
jgi:3',5'-cyclic AMP phosphodiesterase CpdA